MLMHYVSGMLMHYTPVSGMLMHIIHNLWYVNILYTVSGMLMHYTQSLVC